MFLEVAETNLRKYSQNVINHGGNANTHCLASALFYQKSGRSSQNNEVQLLKRKAFLSITVQTRI